VPFSDRYDQGVALTVGASSLPTTTLTAGSITIE